MRRELPSGLSNRQRIALYEFFAGHVSAGQLQERLTLAAREDEAARAARRPPAAAAATAEMPAVRRKRGRAWLSAPVAIGLSRRRQWSLARLRAG